MSDPVSPEIDALLKEEHVCAGGCVRAQASINDPDIYREAADDRSRWVGFAKELSGSAVDESSTGIRRAKWFVGSKLNVSANFSIATSARRRNKAHSSGKASPATAARSPISISTARSASSPTS